MLVHRVGAVGVLDAERALLHLLEAEGEHAIGDAAFDELLGHEQRRGTGGAVVVHVVDRYACQAQAVHRALAAGGFAVAVPDARLLDRRRTGCRRPAAPWCRPPWPCPGSPTPVLPASQTWSCRPQRRKPFSPCCASFNRLGAGRLRSPDAQSHSDIRGRREASAGLPLPGGGTVDKRVGAAAERNEKQKAGNRETGNGAILLYPIRWFRVPGFPVSASTFVLGRHRDLLVPVEYKIRSAPGDSGSHAWPRGKATRKSKPSCWQLKASCGPSPGFARLARTVFVRATACACIRSTSTRRLHVGAAWHGVAPAPPWRGLEVTAKGAGRVAGLVHERPEATVPLSRPPRFPFQLHAGLHPSLEDLVADRPLRPILITQIHRRRIDVLPSTRGARRPVTELALDRVRLRAPDRRQVVGAYCEIEIEQLAGTRRDVTRLAQALQQRYDLAPSTASKFAGGLALLYGPNRVRQWSPRGGVQSNLP